MPKHRPLPRVDRREPGFSFYNAVLRVRWSYWQLRNFKNEIDSWLSAAASMFYLERTRTGVKAYFEAPEMQFWAIYTYTADLIQNLRSSLDYCWMGLVRGAAEPGTKVGRFVYPIGGTMRHLDGKFNEAPLGVFTEVARDIVYDKLSIMHDGRRDLNASLSILNDLNNWQKHNALPIMFGSLHIPEVVFAGGASHHLIKRDVVVPYGQTVVVEANYPYERFEWSKNVSQFIAFSEFPRLADMHIIDALQMLVQDMEKDVTTFIRSFPEALWFDIDRVLGPKLRGHDDRSYRFI